MARTKPIPFTVARSDARTLLAQVADGLREAIVGGYYVPGDIVPSSRELARILGVSRTTLWRTLSARGAQEEEAWTSIVE